MARLALLCLLLLALGGCATHGHAGAPYGFFSGLWHGLIFPYALFANLVSWVGAQLHYDVFGNVELVGRPNEGTLYYLGYGIGLFAYTGSIATTKKIRQ